MLVEIENEKKIITLKDRRSHLKLSLEKRRQELARQAKNLINTTVKPLAHARSGREATRLRSRLSRGDIWLVNLDPAIGLRSKRRGRR